MYILTGRIFNDKYLVGYKLAYINNGKILFGNIKKNELKSYKIINCKYTNRLESSIRVPLSKFPKYDIKGNLKGSNAYLDSDIIAITLNVEVESIRLEVCGAIIAGAIDNTLSNRAIKHAELYYEEIRHMNSDIERISHNTGYKKQDILKIKNYLFMDYHELSSGFKRFDPSFEIAQSWQRLMSKNKNDICNHDITLLKHELMEIELINNGLSQEVAHRFAENKFNYSMEANEYYDKIKKYNNQ